MDNINAEDLQRLLSSLQSLQIENNQLRSEILRPQTPVNARSDSSHKMDYKVIPRPEKFNGDRKGSKVREFCRKVKRYLKCLPHVDKALHLDIVAGFLTGTADTWYTRWEKKNQGSDVESLLDALILHFSPSNQSQEARRKLSNIKQQSSVMKYSERFREYLEEIETIDELEAKTYYINGLKDQVKKEVRLRDLDDEKSLDEVEHIALQVDSILYNRDTSRLDFRSRPYGSSNGVAPMQGVQFGNLSLEDAKKYSLEKRCWKCHQQNRHAVGCTSKFQFKSNLAQVEVKEDSVEEEAPLV